MRIFNYLVPTGLFAGFLLISCQKVTEEYYLADRPYFGIADSYKTVEFPMTAGTQLIPVATNIDTAEWRNRITQKDTTNWCNVRHQAGNLEVSVTQNTAFNRADTITVTTTKGKSLSFMVKQPGPDGPQPEDVTTDP